MDLIAGYSQGGAPSEGSTQTLGQAARDVYQGLINPQAWQELQQATKRTQQVIPSILESLGRGSVAQVPGTLGDISALLRQLAPQTTQQVLGDRIAPTTDEILGYVPRMTPNYQGSESHEMMGGLLSPALGYFAKAIPTQMKGMPIGNMIAYHGTPHEIKGGFDISKVGTGEGSQAYGHGMYFAESPDVSKSYMGKTVFNEPTLDKFTNGPNYYTDSSGKHFKVRDYVRNDKPVEVSSNEYNSKFKEVSDLYAKQNQGNLYKVDIPDAYIPTMMDYDKPLGQQSAIVKKALNDIKKQITPEMKMELGGDLNLLFGKDVTPVQFLNTMEIIHPTGGVGIGEKMLNEFGVKGIRYKDAMSRGADEGTSNFVVFDPKEVKILEKNGKPSRKEIIEQAFEGTMPHYKDYENLSSVFEKAGLKIKETGSSKSNSKYVEIQDPVSGEVVTVRFANHPQSGNAMTLHGPADIEIGDIFKHKSWKDAVNPILDRINKSRKEFGDELLTLNNKSKK